MFDVPPDGFLDARRPYPVGDAGYLEGVNTFVVTAPPGADRLGCWESCETDNNSEMHTGMAPPNPLLGVEDNGDGTFTITLERPIAHGEVTTITYSSSTGATVVTGAFTYLPGDCDGDGTTAPADILCVVDCLNSPPCELSRCDCDRDGECAPADILCVIDLLNGAGEFEPWLDVMIDPEGCP